MTIETKGIRKAFGTHAALADVSIELPGGKLNSLLGPSGCGKTTLLRVIAGLEQPDAGAVLFDNEDQTGVHPRRRKVGFVFQHYALFRRLTVFENVAFGLRVKPRAQRPSKDEIRRAVHEMLSLVQLDNQSHKFPHEMSGGQRQRVALARALVIKPRILLLDEPFGALDANVRKDLRRWLRRLHDEIHLTSILVTHDQEEALEVSDKVVVMNEGRIEQTGSPEAIYRSPANPFVYEFLGSVNVFRGRVKEDRLVHYEPVGRVERSLELDTDHQHIYVRPHEFEISARRLFPEDLSGRILRSGFIGHQIRLEIESAGSEDAPTGGNRPGGGRRDDFFEIQVPFEVFDELGLKSGDSVYFRPRSFRTFLGEGI